VDLVFASAVFAFGLCFGSFLNVCIYRLPLGKSIVHPRSACPACQKQIVFYDNIPVLSWLVLRGHCRYCHTPISVRYLIVEVLTGGLFLACYEQYGLTLAALKFGVFGFLLLGLIFTDAETQLLPDWFTLPGLGCGLAFSLVVPVNDLVSRLLPGLFALPALGASWRAFSFLDSFVGAAVGASFIYGAGAIYFRARGVEGMGFGDVKLMAMVGAFLGLRLTIFTIFAGSIAGSLFGLWTIMVVWMKRTQRRMQRRHESAREARQHAWGSAMIALRRFPMPFGVFLGGMAMIATFFGKQLMRWYWRMP
jgi:leader peptidase (prepilin peptidase) / N-methyltransferase